MISLSCQVRNHFDDYDRDYNINPIIITKNIDTKDFERKEKWMIIETTIDSKV